MVKKKAKVATRKSSGPPPKKVVNVKVLYFKASAKGGVQPKTRWQKEDR